MSELFLSNLENPLTSNENSNLKSLIFIIIITFDQVLVGIGKYFSKFFSIFNCYNNWTIDLDFVSFSLCFWFAKGINFFNCISNMRIYFLKFHGLKIHGTEFLEYAYQIAQFKGYRWAGILPVPYVDPYTLEHKYRVNIDLK